MFIGVSVVRVSVRVSVSTLTPSWISLAIIRPVSLRLQDEGQKKLTDCTDAHGVFDHGSFLTFSFDAKGF